jgi:hypothetical protein
MPSMFYLQDLYSVENGVATLAQEDLFLDDIFSTLLFIATAYLDPKVFLMYLDIIL